MVKRIFETEFHKESKLDIIQEPNRLFEILNNLIEWNRENQFFTCGIIKSPISGKEDSTEFFLYLKLKKCKLRFNHSRMIRDVIK